MQYRVIIIKNLTYVTFVCEITVDERKKRQRERDHLSITWCNYFRTINVVEKLIAYSSVHILKFWSISEQICFQILFDRYIYKNLIEIILIFGRNFLFVSHGVIIFSMLASEFMYKTRPAIRSRLMNCDNFHIQLHLNLISAIFIKLSELRFKYVKTRGEVYRLLIMNIYFNEDILRNPATPCIWKRYIISDWSFERANLWKKDSPFLPIV